ncbi:MAG: DUF2075 domain-containing protein [Candidatus Wallbacteria bacterium]|nr:DUF2075 domain-containing protein [Candidatus Wallbacteria bacterium]
MSLVIGHPLSSAVKRSYFWSPIDAFCRTAPESVLGQMAARNDFDLTQHQRDAWLTQAEILQAALREYEGAVFLEFAIPRMGRRVDAVVLVGPAVFVLEFKVGENAFTRDAIHQVTDYALDLHHFHEESHQVCIAPVLICTEARAGQVKCPKTVPEGRVLDVALTDAIGLKGILGDVLRLVTGAHIAIDRWSESRYKPTPTIVEATLALYRGHSVAEITRSDADTTNLSRTATVVGDIIATARKQSQKSICFVTGVPGAGKTLVGLDAATRHISTRDELYSVFLSGNGPLVTVLQEALARDKVQRTRESGKPCPKGHALSEVKAFIQNVHHFRDDCLAVPDKPPVEHVAIFDEAQRAWNLEMTVDFMKRKKGVSSFSQSEPEFLISCLDRHRDWAAIVCLVGEGQEINRGEAGIREWLEAMARSYPLWTVHASRRLGEGDAETREQLASLGQRGVVHLNDDLHLGVSVRSFRSEKVSRLVREVLDLDEESARSTLRAVQGRYPITLSRNLQAARRWVREHARGSERFGIVVSSQAERLKPHALDVKTPVNPIHWFLGSPDDVRSSYYLEDVATEFHIQGLELDWTCVVWDADLRRSSDGWEHWSFRGSRWQRIHSPDRQRYLKNAYRVLLTRARQGMVIVVPEGDPGDPTRAPAFYDDTYRYLKSLAIQEI